MKIVNASIRRYRSIEDVGEFDVEEGVTCLVGKNESGKTAVLQSLYKSNPVDKAAFDEGLDFPSRLTRERKKGEPIAVTTLSYKLEDGDVSALQQRFGVGAVSSDVADVTMGYRYERSTWSVETNQEAAVRHLAKNLDLPAATKALVDAAKTTDGFVAALEAMEAAPADVTAAIATVKGWRGGRLSLAVIDLLNARRPKFVYFGDYDAMPGKVSIPDLIRKRDADELDRGEEAVLALLGMAGVTLEEFLVPASHEHLIRDLENASNSISEEVFEYWTQNKNLSVRLDIIGQPEPGAVGPLDAGPLLQIRVVNQRHNVSVPFDERSRGFVWFFSFLAYFSQIEENAATPLVLLLDEPGLNLHATAQADLLRFIDERLAPHHQVMFSTHSPFMIDAHNFQQVRTVVDDEKAGTLVSADVLRADAETAFPLHAALGIELSQTLFVGPDVLLVEGPSDVLYLEVLSDLCKSKGKTGLDERFVITPAGGIAKLPAFVTLLGANQLNTVVLIDSSVNNAATIARLREAGRLNDGGLVEVGPIVGQSECDVEDLFDPDFYLELVNAAYQGALSGRKFAVRDLPEHDRLVRRVELAFSEQGINNGRLNHYSPARVLMRDQEKFGAKVSDRTLERAGQLFEAINATLGSS